MDRMELKKENVNFKLSNSFLVLTVILSNFLKLILNFSNSYDITVRRKMFLINL